MPDVFDGTAERRHAVDLEVADAHVGQLIAVLAATVDDLHRDVLRFQSVELDARTQVKFIADLRGRIHATRLDVHDGDAGPGRTHARLPCGKCTGARVAVVAHAPLEPARRDVHPLDVFAHHPVRAERGRQRRERVPDLPHPCLGDSVAVALVEARCDLVLDEVVERFGLEGVTLGAVSGRIRRRDGPAVLAVEVLVPPAVEDRQVECAVEGRLHAGGPARLQRPQRVVQPDIRARVQQLRHADVVVRQEHHAGTDVRLGRELHQLLDEPLAFLVRRVRLARDDDLHRPHRIQEDGAQPVGVVQHERQALVGGDPPREPDGQHRRVEQVRHPGGRDAAGVLALPGFRDTAAGVADQLLAHPRAHRPEVEVAETARAPVGSRRVGRSEPIFGERPQHRVGPGRCVHTVRHRVDRNLVDVESRPQSAEHPAADLTVQFGYAVGVLSEPQSHHSHVEDVGRTARVVLCPQCENIGHLHARKQIVREVAFDQRPLEPVDAGSDGRVRGEDGAGTHDLEALVEGQPFADEVGDALDTQESGVAFVGVEDLGLGHAGEFGPDFERADAADAQQELLQQAMLSPAAVQAVGDRSQRVVVLGDVRVEKQEADAADRRLPDPRVQRTALGKCECDLHGCSVRLPEHGKRQPVRIEHRVALHLPAVGRDRLREVSGPVEEADPDERDPEVGGALQMVARQNAESTGILREGGGDSEFG